MPPAGPYIPPPLRTAGNGNKIPVSGVYRAGIYPAAYVVRLSRARLEAVRAAAAGAALSGAATAARRTDFQGSGNGRCTSARTVTVSS